MIFKRQEATAIHQKWHDTGSISRFEVVTYFSYVRFVIEQAEQPPSTVQTLSTYCDWLNHARLDRSQHFGPLKRATTLLSKGNSLPNFHDDIVNGFLNTHGLVREMQLFNMHYASGTLEGENEYQLLKVISEELMGKPLSIFKKGAPIAWDAASKKMGLAHDFIVVSGLIHRNTSLDGDGAFNYSLRLETVRKRDDEINTFEFDYLRYFPRRDKWELRINLDAYTHPMYHTHPFFDDVGHL